MKLNENGVWYNDRFVKKASWRETRELLKPSSYNAVRGCERKQEQFYIKRLGDEYRIVKLKSVQEKYVSRETLEQEAERNEREFDEEIERIFSGYYETEHQETYKKLGESLSRTKRTIYEYARCNDWDYFVTLTLDAEKIDRYDLGEVAARMKETIQGMNYGVTHEDWGRQEKVEYLLIPELHKDGAIHFHGFMRGFHKSDLRKNEHDKLEWKQWRDNFGYCNIEKIKNRKAASAYATKYITKDLQKAVTEKGAHMFYASHGLQKAEIVYRGGGAWAGEWDWVHEKGYCAIATVSGQFLHDNFVGEWGDCIDV